MAKTCKTCQRPDVDEINALITQDIPFRNIMVDRDGLSLGGLHRHRDKCLEALFAEVRESKRAGLLASVDDVKTEIAAVKTEFGDNGYIRLGLIGKMFDAIDKEAKLIGAYTNPATNPTDITNIAKEVADRLIAKGWSESEAKAYISERYPQVSEAVN